MNNSPIFLSLSSIALLLFASCSQSAVKAPIMGWSSWNTYHVDISDSLIMRQADAMIGTGLHAAGYDYVNIDDGYFGGREADGTLFVHPDRFPGGLQKVVEHIHGLGLKAGIYSEAGINTCGSIYDDDERGVGVGLYGHERQDADLFFGKWGFDFIKIDYCGGLRQHLDERTQYTMICKAVDEASEGKASVNICRWAFPGTWARELATSWRISGDIRPNWPSVRGIIEKNLYLSAFAGDGHYNDMDMLEIGRGLTPTEEQTHFAMWCAMSSPLLIGCDLTEIAPTSLELLKNEELIALNQDRLALQAKVTMHVGDTYVLVKDVEKLHGTTRAVVLYNPSDSTAHFKVPVAQLCLDRIDKIRDLGRRKDMEPCGDTLEMDVEPHGATVLRMEAKKRLRQVVYEAEEAFLTGYDALGKTPDPISFMEASSASGGIAVANLGGARGSRAVWEDVYCPKGGRYKITAKGDFANGGISIKVNGEEGVSAAKGESACFPTDLKRGSNRIEVGSSDGTLFSLDCIGITPLP